MTAVTAGEPENWAYSYDQLDRLLTATNGAASGDDQTFRYDVANNITYQQKVGTYVYPAAGAVRPHAVSKVTDSAGATLRAFGHDANGNMTLSRVYAGGVEVTAERRTIGYDFENRPLTVTRAGATTTTGYGPDGERFRKQVTQAGQPTRTNWFLGADVEVTEGGAWTFTPHPDVRIVLPGGTGTAAACYVHRDQLASVKAETDATGALALELRYLPFGVERPGSTAARGCAGEETRGWIGERADPETGLTYLHARWYDATLGRFVTPDWWDPVDGGAAATGKSAGVVGNNVGTNRFSYAANNPLNSSDSNGHASSTSGIDLANGSDGPANHNQGENEKSEIRGSDFDTSGPNHPQPGSEQGSENGKGLNKSAPIPTANPRHRSFAFVGGAGDETRSHIMYDVFVKFRATYNSSPFDAMYFTYDQDEELADWIDSRSRPSIFSHSYGADTAATVVAAGHPVESLVTIDPVGFTRPDFAAVARNTGKWTNYNAVGGGFTWSNAVALGGRKYGHAIRDAGYNSIDIDADHADIVFSGPVQGCINSGQGGC